MEEPTQSSSAAGLWQDRPGMFSSESVLDILKLIFAGAPLSEVLTIVARLVEAQSDGMVCTIFMLDDDGQHLRCRAAPSLPGFVAQIGRIPVGPKCASCGTAVYRKEPVYVTDILSDPLWDDYRHLLEPYGLRAVWARPLLSSEGKVLGTFATYYREARSPSNTDKLLIENASQIAGIAIERQINEEQLKRSEARKTAILESALDCIVTIDHEGCITEFNPAAERTFGYVRSDVLGKSLVDVIIPPSFRDKHRDGFVRYLNTGEAQVLGKHIEMTAMRADGSELPVELAITRIPLDGPPSFTGYLRDITERKRAEEELRRSDAFLAEAQRVSLTGSFSWRVDSDDITFSDELCRIFEFDRDAPVTLERISTRVHPEDIPLLQEKIAIARRTASDTEYEIRLRMPDGKIKYVQTIGHRTRDVSDRLEYIGSVRDVTRERLAEQALSEARSELAHVSRVTSLGVLTASIAHEVNQPLTGIVTNASTCLRMLAADPPNIEGARETARRTIRDGNRAADVISRLRALFSKKDTTVEEVDLNDATQEVIALSQSNLQRNRVIVRPELATDLPPIPGDRVQLQQVILNLVLNASEAMSDVTDRPRQLVIRTERSESDSVSLAVQDWGIGFGPHGVDKLFETFYTTKSGGMGIGLSVSRSIIESHHGRLWAAPNDGPGATFVFSIPRGGERLTDVERHRDLQTSVVKDPA